ncbi:MAG: hypothetical protein HQK96_16830 [Nitrospirae bacterium]|nr:hypothetical protein [Nitrospirota bacterium]
MKEYLKVAKFLSTMDVKVYSALSDSGEFPSFPSDSVSFEVKKAALIAANPKIKKIIHEIEDNPFFIGSIHAILPDGDSANIEDLYTVFKEIWSYSDHLLIVRAMLANNFEGINVGPSGLGDKYFFGHDEYWNTVLTATNPDIDIVPFLQSYATLNFPSKNPADNLNLMVNKWLANNSDNRDWRYYFIKYPEMFSEAVCQFSWRKDIFDFNIRRLNAKKASAYHINPYVYVVAVKVHDLNVCDRGDSYARGYEFSPLKLKNKTQLWSEELGWRIVVPEGISVTTHQFPSMQPTGNANEYLLKETQEKDRIEIAVDFVYTLGSKS